MRLARVLGAIGRALISAGVIVLLFVAYQLWGTGVQHQQAQNNLEDDFLELIDSDAAAEAQQIQDAIDAVVAEAEAEAAASDDVDLIDSGTSEADAAQETADRAAATLALERDLAQVEYTAEFLDKLYPEPGKSMARIVIPDIGVDQITVEGVSVEDLRKGPGHYRNTPNPGQAGNAAIAGHRTTYGAPFHRVDELEPGAEILVTTLQGTFEYRVTANESPDGSIKGHFIVNPSDTWVLGQGTGQNLLTLTACHPKYSARQRIIVQAELVGEPAPTIPREEALDLSPVDISSGATDERASEAPAEGLVNDTDVVMSDEVAIDDDPSVDADGNSVDDAAGQDTADAEPPSDDAQSADEDGVAGAAGDGDEGSGETASAAPADSSDATTVNIANDSELSSAQSPFGEADDFGEGLNGDRTKIKPAIMWGIAGGSIWMAAWFIGRQVDRKWTLYSLGFVPFALVLWACFVNVDQALPSY